MRAPGLSLTGQLPPQTFRAAATEGALTEEAFGARGHNVAGTFDLLECVEGVRRIGNVLARGAERVKLVAPHA